MDNPMRRNRAAVEGRPRSSRLCTGQDQPAGADAGHPARGEWFVTKEVLEHILAHIPVVTYVWRPFQAQSGTILSEHVAEKLGIEYQQCLENRDLLLRHLDPDDLPRFMSALSQLYEDDRMGLEYRFVQSDGEQRWLHEEMKLVRDEDGTPIHIVSCVLDVSAWRTEEGWLRRQMQSLTSIIDRLPGLAYRRAHNPNWTIEFASSGSLELTGYHPWELEHDSAIPYAKVIHPEDRCLVWDKVQAALTRKERFHLKYRIVTASGQTKWVSDQGWQAPSPEDDVIVLEGFITEQAIN